MRIAAGEVFQQLSKPGKVTIVTEDTEKTIWKITTQQYQLQITRTPDSVEQICTTPDGELEKVKERGEVTESFKGMNQDQVTEVCAQAELDIQEEVEKMEQIKSESEIPSTETKTSVGGGVKIKEINVSAEWVKLENSGDNNVNLDSWKLMNGKESGTGTYTYTFGNFSLASNGYVYVYSDDAGQINCTDTATGLCWNRTSEWDSTRDIAILRDKEGKEVDRCVYINQDVQNNLVICE